MASNTSLTAPTTEMVEAGKRLQAALGVNIDIVTPIFKRAAQVIAVREFLTTPGISEAVTGLAGSPAGFVTDRDRQPEKYSKDVILAACTEALAMNVYLTGNEFNIIAGRMMIVRNGWERLCREWKDGAGCEINSLDIEIENIELDGMNRKCKGVVRYSILNRNGGEIKSAEFRRLIMLTAKNGETADATSGKAERRLFQQFHRFLTGVDIQSHLEMDDGAVVIPAGTLTGAAPAAESLRPEITQPPAPKAGRPPKAAPAPVDVTPEPQAEASAPTRPPIDNGEF